MRLCGASAAGDVEDVRRYLDEGDDINEVVSDATRILLSKYCSTCEMEMISVKQTETSTQMM